MAIEVKELIIRAIATDDEGGSNGEFGLPDEQKIIQKCVNQVLEIIKRNNER